MICPGCQTDGILTSQLKICWCHAELCANCMPEHVKTCTAYARPSMESGGTPRSMPTPPAFKGKHGFEAVVSVMKRIQRTR